MLIRRVYAAPLFYVAGKPNESLATERKFPQDRAAPPHNFYAGIFSGSVSHAQDVDDEDGHDSQARIVRISYVEGEVRLDSGHGYESATMNVPLTERDWLQTGSDGWAEVQLEDGSLIRLAPDTVIAFTELARASSGATLTTVDLDQGEAEFKITKHNGSDFNVTVKKNTIALTHSGTFRVTSTNANPLEIAVLKGEVGVSEWTRAGEVAVKKNETFVLDPNDVARYALDKGADTDELDQWSTQRDDALSAYASAGQGYAVALSIRRERPELLRPIL